MICFLVTEDEYQKLIKLKGRRTWHDYFCRDV